MVYLYSEYQTIILVIIEAPTVGVRCLELPWTTVLGEQPNQEPYRPVAGDA